MPDQLDAALSSRPAWVTVEFRSELISRPLIRRHCTGREHGT
ncbi:hypothetical protein [Streptomyces fagopyri]